MFMRFMKRFQKLNLILSMGGAPNSWNLKLIGGESTVDPIMIMTLVIDQKRNS